MPSHLKQFGKYQLAHGSLASDALLSISGKTNRAGLAGIERGSKDFSLDMKELKMRIDTCENRQVDQEKDFGGRLKRIKDSSIRLEGCLEKAEGKQKGISRNSLGIQWGFRNVTKA